MGVLSGSRNIDDGLVLHFDAANTRSFRGEPTTNAFKNINSSFNPLDLYTWCTGGSTSVWSRDYTQKSPIGGVVLKEVSSGTDSYSGTYNNSAYNLTSASVGQTWTASIYVKANVGTNTQIWLFEANSNGNYTNLSVNSFTASGVWERISVTRTLTQSDTNYLQIRIATSTNGATLYWDGVQIEQKSYVTSFVNGTRGTTVATNGGLIDLSKNNKHAEVNNGPIYNSSNNGSIVMDGVNDVLLVNQNITNSTQCTVVMWLSSTDTQFLWGMGNSGSYYFGASISGGNYYHENCGSPTYYIDGKQVLNPNGYLDGKFHMFEAKGVNLSTWTRLGFLDYGTGSWNMNGKVAIIQVYDRVLSSEESLKNYNANKSRFI